MSHVDFIYGDRAEKTVMQNHKDIIFTYNNIFLRDLYLVI